MREWGVGGVRKERCGMRRKGGGVMEEGDKEGVRDDGVGKRG